MARVSIRLMTMMMAILVFLTFSICAGAGDLFKTVNVNVTAYTLTELKHSDGITASGKEPKVGYIAISRDLEEKHGLSFGDKVFIKGLGEYEIQDRTHFRKKQFIDVYMDCYQNAVQFGVKKLEMVFRKQR